MDCQVILSLFRRIIEDNSNSEMRLTPVATAPARPHPDKLVVDRRDRRDRRRVVATARGPNEQIAGEPRRGLARGREPAAEPQRVVAATAAAVRHLVRGELGDQRRLVLAPRSAGDRRCTERLRRDAADRAHGRREGFALGVRLLDDRRRSAERLRRRTAGAGVERTVAAVELLRRRRGRGRGLVVIGRWLLLLDRAAE